jgi:hypothetical protein
MWPLQLFSTPKSKIIQLIEERTTFSWAQQGAKALLPSSSKSTSRAPHCSLAQYIYISATKFFKVEEIKRKDCNKRKF